MTKIELGASSRMIEGLGPRPSGADEPGRGEVPNFCCKPLKTLDSEKEMKGNERKFALQTARRRDPSASPSRDANYRKQVSAPHGEYGRKLKATRTATFVPDPLAA